MIDTAHYQKNAMIVECTQAILRGDSYYKGISLPSPQLSGTYSQQRAYARQQAEKIVAKKIK